MLAWVSAPLVICVFRVHQSTEVLGSCVLNCMFDACLEFLLLSAQQTRNHAHVQNQEILAAWFQ